MSYIRGVVTTEDGNLGLLQSVNYNTSVEEAIEKDARGNTANNDRLEYSTASQSINKKEITIVGITAMLLAWFLRKTFKCKE